MNHGVSFVRRVLLGSAVVLKASFNTVHAFAFVWFQSGINPVILMLTGCIVQAVKVDGTQTTNAFCFLPPKFPLISDGFVKPHLRIVTCPASCFFHPRMNGHDWFYVNVAVHLVYLCA